MASRQELIRNAERQAGRGKLNAAIESYLRVLEENPDDTTTVNRVGDLYVRLQRIDEAVELFERAAQHFSEEGFYLKAIAIYKKILRLDPGRLEASENLGDLQARQGLIPEARLQYQEVAAGYKRRSDLESTIAVHRKLVELEPNDPEHRLHLAELLEQQDLGPEAMTQYGAIASLMVEHGKVEDAIKVAREALEIDPLNLDFVSGFVDDLQRQGFAEQAEQFVAHAAEGNPDAAKILAEAEEKTLETEVELEDTLPREATEIGLEQEDDTELELEAEPEVERPVVEEMEFEIDLEDFRPDEPQTVLSALDYDSAEFEGLREQLIEADVLTRYGLEDKAIEKLEEIIVAAPQHLEAHQKLMDLHLDHRNLERAGEIAAMVRDLLPAYGRQDEWESVVERLAGEGFRVQDHRIIPPERHASAEPAAMDLPEGFVPAEQDLSWLDEMDAGGKGVLTADGVFDREEEFFDLASELERELGAEELLDDELLVAPEEQSLEEIVEGFKKGMAETLSAEDYDTHYNLGIAYREMGLIDEAISEFQLAAKDHRYLVDCCSLLASCFIEKGFPELAIKWYEEGLSSPIITEEETLGLVYELGDLYLSIGEQEEARLRFVEIYGVNSEYRDVGTKLAELDQT